MSVPMSLDHVFFDHHGVVEMIPMNKKVASFGDADSACIDDGYPILGGDDGYASMDELSTRSPRKKKGKVSCIHDAYAILVDGCCGTMDDLQRRIRKPKKVMSFDVDDDDDDQVKPKIRKIASMDDVLTAKVTFINKNQSHNKISHHNPTLPRNQISDDDLEFPRRLCFLEMALYLPAMAATFVKKDWSLLRKFCFRMESENLSFEEAIRHELVATCIWFLLAKTYPLHVKMGVASALKFILSSAPTATNMLIDQEKGVDHAPTKMSTDQAYYDALVVEALCSGDEEIVRQVCMTIVFLGAFRQTETVGTCIQSQLLELARSFPFSRDPYVATWVLKAINSMDLYFEDSFMKKRLVESVHSDRHWLLKIMEDPDEDLAYQSYKMLLWITRGKYDEELWEALLYDIFPSILKRCRGSIGYCLSICGAKVISNVINGAATPLHVDALVMESECIDVLLSYLVDVEDEDTINVCMEALEKILKTGDDDSWEFNIYAMEMAEYRKYGSAWSLLDNDAPNSEDILLKYAPLKWLRRNPRFSVILCDLGLDDFNEE